MECREGRSIIKGEAWTREESAGRNDQGGRKGKVLPYSGCDGVRWSLMVAVTDVMEMVVVVGASVGWNPYGGLFQWNGVRWDTVMVALRGKKVCLRAGSAGGRLWLWFPQCKVK